MQELMNLAQMATQLPLNYGGLYQQAYAPQFQYYNNQANNMAQLGGQQMGLYGTLAGQQASMYQAELPHQMEMAKFNAIAPALSGLLSGWSGTGGGGGGGFSIAPISMNFNRPDVMSGYGGAVDRAYGQAAAYDDNMAGSHSAMMGLMPTAAYLPPREEQPPQPANPFPQGYSSRPLPPPQTQYSSAGGASPIRRPSAKGQMKPPTQYGR